MSDEKLWFGLYYDEACTNMLPREVVDGRNAWILDFGRLDAGESKSSEFYVKNLSDTTIEELRVGFVPPMVEGVSASVVSEDFVPEVRSDGVHRVEVLWKADKLVMAGRCYGVLTISAMAIEETIRYRE